LKSFNEMAHKERYTQKQYEAGLKAHLEVFKNLEAKANQAAEAEFKACDEALDKEWGQDRQKRTAEALEVAKKVGIYEALEELKLGSNPKAIKMLDTLRQMMTDDEIKLGSDKTKLSVQEEVKKLIDSESYINGLHPEHTKTMNRLKELYGVK
jgi:tRNA A37 N6-isopentenylltransferase MiaA